MLLRLSAPAGEMLLQSPALRACWGGAEANVAVSLARLRRPSAMVTVLPNNGLGLAARAALRAHGVDTSHVRMAPGRMGLYFLTPGAGVRSSEVEYDRQGSAFAEADLADIDWPALLKSAAWLHVSGVTAAIRPNGAAGALAAMRAAAAAGVPASFDGNFRARLWEAWRGDAPAILGELFAQARLVFADDRDVGLILGKAFDAEDPLERRREAAKAAFSAFPRLHRMASTSRAPLSADRHDLSAIMITRDGAETLSPARNLAAIVDRVGAGDAFAAGLISALLGDRGGRDALDFALAAACVKHSIFGDFNLATPEDVTRAMAEGFDIRR
jgi:2-dehydro-3-deoxygluconokinase